MSSIHQNVDDLFFVLKNSIRKKRLQLESDEQMARLKMALKNYPTETSLKLHCFGVTFIPRGLIDRHSSHLPASDMKNKKVYYSQQ